MKSSIYIGYMYNILKKRKKKEACVWVWVWVCVGGGGVELEEQVIMEEEKTSVRQNFIS